MNSYKELPGNSIKSGYEGPLKDLLIYSKPKSVKKLFYQILPMNINELENKKQFKCYWVSIKINWNLFAMQIANLILLLCS